MKKLLPFLVLSGGLLGYSYYYTDSFSSINSNWTQNASVSASSSGLSATSADGGSLIYNGSVPGPSGEYEVEMTLSLNASSPNATYVAYLNATSNAQTSPGPVTGSFYAVELQNPTFSSSGACTATLIIIRSVNGSVTWLTYEAVPCASTTTVRAIRTYGGQLVAYVNGQIRLSAIDTTLTGGQPGVGAWATGTSYIQSASIGQVETVAPNQINGSTVYTSSFANRVDLQWQGTTENSPGTGVAIYQVFRNGSFFAQVTTTELTDATVSPNTSYTYSLYALDFDLNYSPPCTLTVATPPSGAIDPRRVGVRPTGAYWGASPEQIDVLSGNVNYSLPLLKAQARGGWGIGFNLTYNSENWRQDPTAIWNLGRDVGFGFGWKLLAGSLTPYWSGFWTLDHYLFVDSTGAEYRLNVNNNGLWTSQESIYLTYDSNAGILHFPDGSFWVFGCQSAGTEQDSGTMYPTTIEDSNGNVLS